VRRGFRTLILTTAAFAAAVAFWILSTLPPSAVRLSPSLPATRVTGAYHVHSVRSDGTGTPDEIARAAQSAGLQFVILTDHGDGTRPPDPPAYIDGVLVLDGVEISTDQGHYVAIDIYRAVLENNASEQSAQMIAMRNATDNAHELIDDLTLVYNKTRQATITREMIEIASGAEALGG